jgi:hypothetical protein
VAGERSFHKNGKLARKSRCETAQSSDDDLQSPSDLDDANDRAEQLHGHPGVFENLFCEKHAGKIDEHKAEKSAKIAPLVRKSGVSAMQIITAATP